MMGRLDGKVAILHGGTRGIGEGIAHRFAAEGARLVFTGRDEERGAEVEEAIRRDGGDATFVRTDISDEDQVAACVARTVELHGRLDALVNNAAPTDVMEEGVDVPIAHQDAAGFDRIVKVGIYGLFHACKHGVRAMVDSGGGSIVNISSTSSLLAVRGMTAYAATKGAMNAMTRAIAGDYGAKGIRANSIIVGVVPASGAIRYVADHPEGGPALASVNLVPRLGAPDDIALAAVFLASDESGYTTASELYCDGGQVPKVVFPSLGKLYAEFRAQGEPRR